MKSNNPLVSILVPNYNYGRYLRQCLDSILAQTYDNFEVIFRDNSSTDDSFEIAMEYYPKFKEKGIYFSIHRNKYNVGSDKNSALCQDDSSGEYVYTLASDDYIAPSFIEKCVKVLEENREVSMVMTERIEIDDAGNKKVLPPFYNKNCIVDGDAQAGVFMMSGIAIPGQRMFRLSSVSQTKMFARLWNVAGDWYMNYRMSMVGDVAYIKEPLMYYRVHRGNETNNSELCCLGSFEHYQLLNQFVELAKVFDRKKPIERYDAAVKKLGGMCLRYAFKMIQNDEIKVARKYLILAEFYDADIVKSDAHIRLVRIVDSIGSSECKRMMDEYMKMYCNERTISYDPPEEHRDLIL